MDIIELYCPACEAKIEIKDDAASFNCPNCGCRIVLDSTVLEVESAATVKYNKKNASVLAKIVAAIAVLLLLVGSGLWIFERHIDTELKSVVSEVRMYKDSSDYGNARSRLAAIEYRGLSKKNREYWMNQRATLGEEIVKDEVHDFVSTGDYVHARSVVDSYVPPDGYSDKWETVKEALIKEIDEKQTGNAASQRIPVPVSSKELEGKQYDEALNELKKAGFTNIDLVKISYKSTWYKPGTWKKANPGDVKEVSIENEGKTVNSFKKDDVFLSASKITITYYDVEE